MMIDALKTPRPYLVFALTLLAYSLLASDRLLEQSLAPHFVYLADAWLDGRSALVDVPSTYDLIRFEGQWYVAQQPLPSLLMLPLVVVAGAARVPDVLFTVMLGAGSVALCDLTLRTAQTGISPRHQTLLTVFFGFGTAHLYLSALGTVWFTGQVAATVFLWLFLLSLFWRLPWLAGIALGAVLLARPSIVPGALLLMAAWWWLDASQQNRPISQKLKSLIMPAILFMIPFVLAGAFLGWYNNARFHHPLDFGYDHLQDAGNIQARRLEHGSFSPFFLPENAYVATLKPPDFSDGITPDPWGMGLLWVSPALLLIATAPRTRHNALLLIAATIMLLPALLYHNTGSAQFGYRFVLDALPVLMLLLASSQIDWRWVLLLTVWSVVAHLWGYDWLLTLFYGQGWQLPI